MKKNNVIIGTRGSDLSLRQTSIIQAKLLALDDSLRIIIKIIRTKGDTNMNPIPLDSVGKGWFTKELDTALLDGTVDLCVHSLKDISEQLPDGLVIAGIPEREDPCDVLVSKNNIFLEKLKKNAIIGTDSTRRKAQILHKRPDCFVQSLRGNITLRLKKLEEGRYDAVMLAAAGLHRLGIGDRITQYFDTTDIVPSPGQGALAVVIKKENVALASLVTRLNHATTVCGVETERLFSSKVGGGCKTPIGAYALCDGKQVVLYGMIGSLDGQYIAKASITGLCKNKESLTTVLAEKLLQQSSDWYRREEKILL